MLSGQGIQHQYHPKAEELVFANNLPLLTADSKDGPSATSKPRYFISKIDISCSPTREIVSPSLAPQCVCCRQPRQSLRNLYLQFQSWRGRSIAVIEFPCLPISDAPMAIGPTWENISVGHENKLYSRVLEISF